MATSLRSGRSPDTRTYVVCVAYKPVTRTLAPTASAACPSQSWRRDALWNACTAAVVVARANPFKQSASNQL